MHINKQTRAYDKVRSGFTLIELLVVIAIIAILAAILFPVFGRARENARRSSCQSNLKQIGLGILQYNQDYDERFPPSRSNGTPNVSWPLAVQPYVKSTQLFRCPSNTGPSDQFIDGTNGTILRSYVANGTGNTTYRDAWGGIQPMNENGTPGGGISIAQINSASQLILVGEHPGDSNNDPEYYRPDQSSNFTFQNHLGTTNFLFADGHVKSMKPLATATPINLWNVNNTTLPNDTTPGPGGALMTTQLGAQQTKMN